MLVIFFLRFFQQFGLDCWGFLATMTHVTHLLFRQSIFPKLTLFLYLTLFITYLCFCFNCTCRSVNKYQLFHLTPCYKRAFFITVSKCQSNVCLCGCLFESRFKSCIVNTKDVQLRQVFACDLHHERYRLNQTFDTCKREHVSCLAACCKLTTPATSPKSSGVPLVTYRKQCNILTSVG